MQQSFYDQMPKNITVRDGIALRLLVSDDAEQVYAILQADPDIRKFITWTFGLETIDTIRKAITEFHKNHELRYAVVEDGKLIGYIGVWKDEGYFGITHEDEYGYGYFCDPSRRRQGIATDSAKALMKTIESTVPVKTFAVYIDDINIPSKAAAAKLGFKATDEVYPEPVLKSNERRYVKVVTPTQ